MKRHIFLGNFAAMDSSRPEPARDGARRAKLAGSPRVILSAAVVLLSASALAQTPVAPGPPPLPPAPTDVATTPGAHIVTGQAPVVGGNAAGARERALDDAIKQAVNQAIAAMLDAPARAAQAKSLKAIEAKARSFVPRYRALEEGEANGVYTIRLEAEVDEIALRRKIERGTSTTASPPVTPSKMGAPGTLVAAADKNEASAAFVSGLVTALSSAGVRARAADPGETSAGAAAQAAARASLEQAALVTSEVVPEGLVRGTGRVAVSCRANVRLVAAPAGSTITERAATARVFVEADRAADGAAQCRTQLGADLAGRLAGVLPPSTGTAASGDLRAVTVDADVVEPTAIPELVKSLRGIGAVSAVEVTRVAAGRAEIRVRTRAAPAAVAAALSRVVGSVITLSDVQTSGDTIRVRVRVRPPAPAPGGNP
jgi:hypothetical protein